MILQADKGFTGSFDSKLQRASTAQAGDGLRFHPTVALYVSKPPGAAGGEIGSLLKMPILIGKYLLTGALGRHAHDF